MTEVLVVPIGERPYWYQEAESLGKKRKRIYSVSYPRKKICQRCRNCELCLMGDIVNDEHSEAYIWKCLNCDTCLCTNGMLCQSSSVQGQCIECIEKDLLHLVAESILAILHVPQLVSLCIDYYHYTYLLPEDQDLQIELVQTLQLEDYLGYSFTRRSQERGGTLDLSEKITAQVQVSKGSKDSKDSKDKYVCLDVEVSRHQNPNDYSTIVEFRNREMGVEFCDLVYGDHKKCSRDLRLALWIDPMSGVLECSGQINAFDNQLNDLLYNYVQVILE
jgi:hypothetical protein